MTFHGGQNTFVGQVALKVQDLERSLAFYQNIIGFRVLTQSATEAVFTADGQTPLLSIEQRADLLPKQSRTTGLYHFALLLPTRFDLGKVLKHLVESGYPLQGASDHLVSEAIYLADPDGNGIEIYRDRPSETWEWNESEVVMATEPMDAQGVLAASDGKAWAGLPKDTVMGHIHLHVSELAQTEVFYQTLGFDVVNYFHNQALFMSTGRYHHHIGLNIWNGVGAPAPVDNSVGLKFFTLIFPNEAARNQIVKQLKAIGADVIEENGQLFTNDPSGNKIKLVV
ncbi:VOC family protein [Priestia megaterium]|nr:VOC family protein [Priestia megaterium]